MFRKGTMNRRTRFFIATAAVILGAADAVPVFAEVPQVALSKRHQALCKVKVGDKLPNIELPKLGGGNAKLADLAGKKATVVLWWRGNRRMAREQLADMGPDVEQPFAKQGVAVVGIVVDEPAQAAQATLQKAKAVFPNLLDAGGKAFGQIGSERLPRTFVLDADGKIVWFDIEYSHATRRELKQTLNSLTGNPQ
jgi:peroxiredoxin